MVSASQMEFFLDCIYLLGYNGIKWAIVCSINRNFAEEKKSGKGIIGN